MTKMYMQMSKQILSPMYSTSCHTLTQIPAISRHDQEVTKSYY